MKTINFLDFSIVDSNLQEVIAWSFAQADRANPKIIAVLNINKLWISEQDAEIRRYIELADVVLPEYAIAWGTRVLYGKRISPIYGIEYAKAALQYSAEKDHRLFLLGGLSNRIPQLESSIMRDYPGIQLAGTHHGYLNEVEDPQLIVRQISQSNADILMVGMGSPRQEKWIWRNRHRLNIPVLIGVGGSFDVISGNKQDTPKWVRGSGFEWAYRTAGDPGSYWRRYLITNPWFLWQILSAKLRIR